MHLTVFTSDSLMAFVTELMLISAGTPDMLITTGMSRDGSRSFNPFISCLRWYFSKSRRMRLSSSSGVRPGFISMVSRTPSGLSAILLLALSTSGPDTPKWVNSISPSSSYTSLFFLLYALRVTFLSESPANFPGHSSTVASGMRDGRISVTVWPSFFAKA